MIVNIRMTHESKISTNWLSLTNLMKCFRTVLQDEVYVVSFNVSSLLRLESFSLREPIGIYNCTIQT